MTNLCHNLVHLLEFHVLHGVFVTITWSSWSVVTGSFWRASTITFESSSVMSGLILSFFLKLEPWLFHCLHQLSQVVCWNWSRLSKELYWLVKVVPHKCQQLLLNTERNSNALPLWEWLIDTLLTVIQWLWFLVHEHYSFSFMFEDIGNEQIKFSQRISF